MIEYALSGAVAVLWAMNSVMNKMISNMHYDIITLTVAKNFVFLVIASVCMIPFVKKSIAAVDRKLIGICVLYAILIMIADVTMIYAYRKAKSASIVTAIAYTSPVIAAVLFSVVLDEQVTVKTFFGILVTVLGTIILIS